MQSNTSAVRTNDNHVVSPTLLLLLVLIGLLIPRAVSPIAALIAVFALFQLGSNGGHGLSSDLLVVLVVLFAFQGLALVHHRVHSLGLTRWWLAGLYMLLIPMPHRVGLILAFVGIADTLIDLRGVRGAK